VDEEPRRGDRRERADHERPGDLGPDLVGDEGEDPGDDRGRRPPEVTCVVESG
jgi:hypothetical protein